MLKRSALRRGVILTKPHVKTIFIIGCLPVLAMLPLAALMSYIAPGHGIGYLAIMASPYVLTGIPAALAVIAVTSGLNWPDADGDQNTTPLLRANIDTRIRRTGLAMGATFLIAAVAAHITPEPVMIPVLVALAPFIMASINIIVWQASRHNAAGPN